MSQRQSRARRRHDGVTLAEIYAAVTYALANREDIAAEMELEDRLESEARTRGGQPQALPA